MSNMKFMDACMQGEALLEDIEEYVEEWHEGDSEEEIYEYLGMTFEEYAIWVENDSMLKTIFYARRIGKSISELIQENNGEKLVARAASPEEAAAVKEWLKKTGRLDG
ncbi:hypothetical protein [Fredinandcohnia sp. 179-A 10B2 NHS]|uniref:hypothetical protein n=1 Tax=Fredinandcohnia sp. 179-A 10B2 NHS TaxID=3235176 RepID=UPI00399FCF0A